MALNLQDYGDSNNLLGASYVTDNSHASYISDN